MMINYSNKYTFYGFFEILQIFISDDTCQIEKAFYLQFVLRLSGQFYRCLSTGRSSWLVV